MNRPVASAVWKWCRALAVLVAAYALLGVSEPGPGVSRPPGIENLPRAWQMEGESWSAVLIRLVASLKLYGAALLAVGGFGIPLGVFAGGIRFGWLRRGFVFLFVVLISLPTISLAFAGIYLAVEVLEVPALRSAGAVESHAGGGAWRRALGDLWFVLLPAGVLAIPGIGKVAIAVRAAVTESMQCQSMIALASRGLSRHRRLYRYALPASWWAALRAVGDAFPRIVGASIIVEWMFDYRGLGARGFEAVLAGEARLLVMLAMLMAMLVLAWRMLLEVAEAAAFKDRGGAGA